MNVWKCTREGFATWYNIHNDNLPQFTLCLRMIKTLSFCLFVCLFYQTAGWPASRENNIDKCTFSNVTAQYNFQIDGNIMKPLFWTESTAYYLSPRTSSLVSIIMQIFCIYCGLHYLLSVHELVLMEANLIENRRWAHLQCYPNINHIFHLIHTCWICSFFLYSCWNKPKHQSWKGTDGTALVGL